MIVETHLQNTQPITQATTSWPGQFFIKNLFAEFNRSNIRYAVMRNYQNLPGSTDGSDLDIIVHPVNKNIAKKIIFDVINRSNGVPIGHVNMPGFLKIFVLGVLKEEEKEILWWGIRLDISFGLIFKGATNLMEWREDQIISHNEVRVLSDSLANVLGVLKEVLNNNQLPKRYLDSARNAVAVEWANISLALAPMGSKALHLLRMLLTEKPETGAIYDRCSAIRKALRRYAFRQAPSQYLKRRAFFEWSKVRRYISPPGLMIAILGVDGSGKSTIIEAIRPVLEEATHNALFIKHLRPMLLPPLARLKGEKSVQEGPVLEPHGSTPSGMVGSILRLIYLTLDYIFGYWLKIRPKIAKQPAIVLFDRYAYDMAMDPHRFRIGLSGKIAGCFISLVTKPDLIFCLCAKPESLIARKQEITIDETKRQVLFLNNFIKNEPRAVLVSTETSIEDSKNQLLHSLYDFLLQKKSAN